MIRNLKLYFSFLMASLKEMMEYRTDFIIGMISQVSYQIIELIFIWIVFQNTDSIAGWTFIWNYYASNFYNRYLF